MKGIFAAFLVAAIAAGGTFAVLRYSQGDRTAGLSLVVDLGLSKAPEPGITQADWDAMAARHERRATINREETRVLKSMLGRT